MISWAGSAATTMRSPIPPAASGATGSMCVSGEEPAKWPVVTFRAIRPQCRSRRWFRVVRAPLSQWDQRISYGTRGALFPGMEKPRNQGEGDRNQGEGDRNQGEGDRISAGRYDRHLQEFISESKVDDAAHKAREFVAKHPDEARRSECEAKAGPKATASAHGIIAKGRMMFERIRHVVRERLGR